jgi:phosphodiesterase/alkaline phosphatase D-like protein
MNLWRFFLCDVFFFGTARKMDSHSSDSIGGTLRLIDRGIASGNPNSDRAICWGKRAALDRSVGVALDDTCKFESTEGKIT